MYFFFDPTSKFTTRFSFKWSKNVQSIKRNKRSRELVTPRFCFLLFIKTSHAITFEVKTMKMKLKNFYKGQFKTLLGYMTNKVRTPPKMAIFFFWGGGSTFWIFWWCNGRILLKIFLVRILGKRIFLTEFSADRPKFRPQTHKWNFKNWRFLEIFFKFSVFFFSNWFKTSASISKK